MQQVRDSLMDREFGIAHPCLGQQPVPLVVTGQEDGAGGSWSLAELDGKGQQRPSPGLWYSRVIGAAEN